MLSSGSVVASLQAPSFKQSDKHPNPGPKAQASSQNQQAPESSSQSTSAQAHVPGASNQDKGILRMFHESGNRAVR